MDDSLPPGQRALDRFPRFGTNQGPPPAVPAAPVIELAGAVDEPATIAAADLASLPRQTLLADFHCVAGWSARGLRWDGVPLREVLRPSAAATHVRLVGLDGHWSVMLLEDALADDVLLADHLDGERTVLVYRVASLDDAVAALAGRGWEAGPQFGIPHGPCVELTTPAGHRIALYERTRPEADERLGGRRDF